MLPGVNSHSALFRIFFVILLSSLCSISIFGQYGFTKYERKGERFEVTLTPAKTKTGQLKIKEESPWLFKGDVIIPIPEITIENVARAIAEYEVLYDKKFAFKVWNERKNNDSGDLSKFEGKEFLQNSLLDASVPLQILVAVFKGDTTLPVSSPKKLRALSETLVYDLLRVLSPDVAPESRLIAKITMNELVLERPLKLRKSNYNFVRQRKIISPFESRGVDSLKEFINTKKTIDKGSVQALITQENLEVLKKESPKNASPAKHPYLVVDIEQVNLKIKDGVISEVVATGNYLAAHNLFDNPNRKLRYVNKSPIPIRVKNDIRRLNDIKLVLENPGDTNRYRNQRGILLGELINFERTPNLGVSQLDPKGVAFSLRKRSEHFLIQKQKTPVLEIRTFSDLLGFDLQRPNGVAQVEVYKSLPVFRRINFYGFSAFSEITPFLEISRLFSNIGENVSPIETDLRPAEEVISLFGESSGVDTLLFNLDQINLINFQTSEFHLNVNLVKFQNQHLNASINGWAGLSMSTFQDSLLSNFVNFGASYSIFNPFFGFELKLNVQPEDNWFAELGVVFKRFFTLLDPLKEDIKEVEDLSEGVLEIIPTFGNEPIKKTADGFSSAFNVITPYFQLGYNQSEKTSYFFRTRFNSLLSATHKNFAELQVGTRFQLQFTDKLAKGKNLLNETGYYND